MRRAARGCWSHYHGKRRAHAVCDINESTATYRKARRVRREATTDRGHHCGMRRVARGCWGHYYGKRRAHKDSNKLPQISAVRQDATTYRGHHLRQAKSSRRLLEPRLWHAKSSKMLLEPLLWQAKSDCSVRHQRVDCNIPQSSACAARSYN